MSLKGARQDILDILAEYDRDEALTLCAQATAWALAHEGCMSCREMDWRTVQRFIRENLLLNPCRSDCGAQPARSAVMVN